MWTIAEYEATALFSLKPATATSSGGKTLLVPTPYAIKMALLDVICRLEGEDAGRAIWPSLAAMRVAIRPPRHIVVANSFSRILKLRREGGEADSESDGPYQKSIAYREYAYLAGQDGEAALGIALWSEADISRLSQWMGSIQYLGKRGSFVQLQSLPTKADVLPARYIEISGKLSGGIPLNSIMQQLDDTSTQVTFDQVSAYGDARIVLGQDRLLRSVLLPYRITASSRGYTVYERID